MAEMKSEPKYYGEDMNGAGSKPEVRRILPDTNNTYARRYIRLLASDTRPLHLPLPALEDMTSGRGEARFNGTSALHVVRGMRARTRMYDYVEEAQKSGKPVRYCLQLLGISGPEHQRYNGGNAPENLNNAMELQDSFATRLNEGDVLHCQAGYELMPEQYLTIPQWMPHPYDLYMRYYTELVPHVKMVRAWEYDGTYEMSLIPARNWGERNQRAAAEALQPSFQLHNLGPDHYYFKETWRLWLTTPPGMDEAPTSARPVLDGPHRPKRNNAIVPVPHFTRENWILIWGKKIFAAVHEDGTVYTTDMDDILKAVNAVPGYYIPPQPITNFK